MKTLMKVSILVLTLPCLVTGCGDSKKKPASDLATTTEYWKLRHLFDKATEARQVADKTWTEMNSFLLAQTGDPAKWTPGIAKQGKETEARHNLSVEQYNQLAQAYNDEFQGKSQGVESGGAKPINKDVFCNRDGGYLPGNIPSPIPCGLKPYVHGERWRLYNEFDTE